MQKGNYCNSLQTTEGERMNVKNDGNIRYTEANRELILRAQMSDEDISGSAMEELVIINRGLVRSIAMRFRERGVDFEDLMQIGTIGLLKAIKSFDLARGTCFSTYAVPMIFGEIRRSLRDEGPLKIGRYYKKLAADLAKLKNEILLREGREAHLGELASALGVSLEDSAMAIEAMSPISSFSDLLYGADDGTVLEDVLADEESTRENERLFDRIALREAIVKMPLQWQKIVALRYYRNKTQQEVANALGLSQVKVSREEKKIIAFLQKEMR